MLVTGHPHVTPASGPPLTFLAGWAHQPLYKEWDRSSPGENQRGHSTLLHHIKIWTVTLFFYDATNPVHWSSVVLICSLPHPPLLSFPITLSIPARCPATSLPPSSLQTAPRPFPFHGDIIFCGGLTKSTCWLGFLGTNANILLMTAPSTEGSLLTFCFCYFCSLLPPGGQQWPPREQTFTCSYTSGWRSPTWEILHHL